DFGDGVRVGGVGQHPRPPAELEDLGLAAQAFADVDADVEIEGDLDVRSPVGLPQVSACGAAARTSPGPRGRWWRPRPACPPTGRRRSAESAARSPADRRSCRPCGAGWA